MKQLTLKQEVDLKQLKKGLTQSEIATWDTCHTKWNLSYNNQLKKKGEYIWHFAVGSALHDFMEKFYRREDPDPSVVVLEEPGEDVDRNDAFQQEWEYWVSVLSGMQTAYVRKYKKDLLDYKFEIVEEVVTREFEGFTFTGKIDIGMQLEDGIGLMDHKTTKDIKYLIDVGWDFKLQFQFYPWLIADRNPRRFTVNGIKKPLLRQTKNETRQGFILRCARIFAIEPDEYFRRESMPVTQDTIKHFEKEVLIPKIREFELAQKHPILVAGKNTNNCNAYFQACPHLNVCRQGWKVNQFQYEQRESKHPELTTETK